MGLINIVHKSNDPAVEKMIVEDVAGYGMQLDKMGNTLRAVLSLMDMTKLDEKQSKAVKDFTAMMDDIDEAKLLKELKQFHTANVASYVHALKELKRTDHARYQTIATQLRDVLDDVSA